MREVKPAGEIEFVRLSEVGISELIRLLNDPRVARHMPLASDDSSEADVREWVAAKERHWDEHGFGPWAIRIHGEFAGWGGLQPFDDEAEIALVLRPEFWGWGRAVFERVTAVAFEELQLTHLVVALPPTRARALGLLRLGFRRVETTEIEGHPFVVYRLDAPAS